MSDNTGKGTVSLVLGILALICCCMASKVWPPYIGVILAIIGIVLAASQNKTNKTGVATGGLVCSIIALVLNGIFAIACTCTIGTIGCIGASL